MGGGGGDGQFSDSPQSNSRRCGAPMLEGSVGSVGSVLAAPGGRKEKRPCGVAGGRG